MDIKRILTVLAIFLATGLGHGASDAGNTGILAGEDIFKSADHCVAYKTSKKMLFLFTPAVIGKNCGATASLEWNSENTKAQIKIVIPVDRFESGPGPRDGHVAEILGGKNLNPMVFNSQFIERSSLANLFKNGSMPIVGNLEINGEGHDVTFTSTVVDRGEKKIIIALLETSFSELEVTVPKVGPGGIIAEIKDELELIAHFQTGMVKGVGHLEH
jgi:polyisoprenoid-binding protein YceI